MLEKVFVGPQEFPWIDFYVALVKGESWKKSCVNAGIEKNTWTWKSTFWLRENVNLSNFLRESVYFPIVPDFMQVSPIFQMFSWFFSSRFLDYVIVYDKSLTKK